MSSELITEGIWKRLTQAAKKSRRRALVAVAYFSEGASKLLPLRPGSRLVVDASEHAVKSGQTCPADLLNLVERGVRVYCVSNLHAKLFVFGNRAFVGSTNASKRSTNTLLEALVVTSDHKTVKAARNYVRDLCLQELGPEALKRLKPLFTRPKIPGGKKRQSSAKKRGRVRPELAGLRLVRLVRGSLPKGSESVHEEGRRVADSKRRRRRTHVRDDFRWNNDSLRIGESVVQIVDEHDGRSLVSPAGEIIHTRRWRKGCSFVYLEVPNQRRIRENKLAKRLGRGAAKRLRRAGRVASDFANKLRAVWQQEPRK